jgi:hypothetical protein
MTNPTTPFSWQMPTSSDLVTDLPADFETFGQAVATSMADLLGGTTGQILSKASNTDMDFTWITNDVGDITAVTAGTGISGGGTSGAVTITNSMATAIDAKGDLIVGTGADTFSRLGVGANGTVLTADSAEATGLKWVTASSTSGPTFRAFQSSNQSVSSETWTKLTLNSETFDTANNFDSTTNYRWTPTTAGYYSISASVNIARTSTNGFGYCRIYKNGANTGANNFAAMGAESQTIVSISDVVYMNGSSDYLEVYVWISGSGATTYSGTSSTYFTGIWIRS